MSCSNGAKSNVKTVQCNYAASVGRTEEGGDAAWRIWGDLKVFSDHVSSTILRAKAKNEKQKQKSEKKASKKAKKEKKNILDISDEIFVAKVILIGMFNDKEYLFLKLQFSFFSMKYRMSRICSNS